MSKSKDAPVLIVGGGIGGVATALAIGKQGRRVQLFEQADQIGAIGYGVQIGPNVMPMLEMLGVGDAVRAAAYLPEEILLYDLRNGDQLSHIPLRTTKFLSRYGGSPYMAIHRVDLHELLLGACKEFSTIEMMPDTAVASYKNTQSGVEIFSDEGKSYSGSALIAADGLRSRLRAQMHPGDVARDTGYVAHRGIVAVDKAPSSVKDRKGVTMWTGPGFHVIYYPLRNRTEINIVVVVKVPGDLDASDNDGYRKHIDFVIASAQSEPGDVISLVNLERKWSIADRNPIRKWSDGNVTLIGDSAHATLQSLAQGAGMAIEDAATLGALITSTNGDYELAFKQLSNQRFARTARVQLESRRLWEQYHCDETDAEVRSLQYMERNAEDHYRCLDWLWTPQILKVKGK